MNSQVKTIKKVSTGFYGWLEITNRCNLKCPYCYANSTFDNKSFLTLDKIKQILKDFRDVRTTAVMLSGGEPFLHKNISSILKYSYEIGQKVVVITNGTMITEDVAKLLAKYNIPVQLSLDSVDKKTYKKSRGLDLLIVLLNRIKLLQKYKVQIFLAVTLTDVTKYGLEDVINYAVENNIQNVHIGELVPVGRGARKDLKITSMFPIYKKLYELQKKNFLFVSIDIVEYYVYPLMFNEKRYYYCNGASGEAVEVSAQGEVSFCMNIQDKAFGPSFDLKETSLKEIKSILDKTENKGLHIDNIEECKDCEYKYICCGGCRAIAYNSSDKRIGAKSPYCKDIKCFIDYVKRDIESGKANDYVSFVRKHLPDRKNLITKYF